MDRTRTICQPHHHPPPFLLTCLLPLPLFSLRLEGSLSRNLSSSLSPSRRFQCFLVLQALEAFPLLWVFMEGLTLEEIVLGSPFLIFSHLFSLGPTLVEDF